MVDKKLEVARDTRVEPSEIEALREQVGWDRCPGTYAEILRRHYAYYTVRNHSGQLVGYLSVLSDGIADAFLLDLMVHPAYQHGGIGRLLVQTAVSDLRRAGIRCVQVTFGDHLESFYKQCWFHIFSGGIIDFKNMVQDDHRFPSSPPDVGESGDTE